MQRFDSLSPVRPRPVPPKPPAPRQILRKTFEPPASMKRKSRRRKVLTWTLHILVTIGLLGSVFLPQTLLAGQIIMLVGAVLAIGFKVESRRIFASAVVMLVAVLASYFALGPDVTRMYAVYAFLSLVLGAVCLAREVYGNS